MSPLRTTAATLLLAALALPGSAAQATELRYGARAGFSVNPDQLVLGGHVQIHDLFEMAPGLVLEPSLTLGFGDRTTTVQVSGDFKYAFELQAEAAPIEIYPLLGLGVAHYAFDNPNCDLIGQVCSTTEIGLELGGGASVGPWAADLVIGLSGDPGIPDLRVLGSFTF
jgi:hypothetical protein